MIEDTPYSLTLVRHGESTWNELGLVQGHNDEARLTDLGRQQAADVAEDLRSRGFDVILSSDLRRASETAAVIAAVFDLPVETDPTLRERGFGVAEGRPIRELDAQLVGISSGVVTNDNVGPYGGETLRELRERAGRFVERFERERSGQRALVVTHGGMMHALQSYCEGTPLQGARWDRIVNGTVLTVTPTRPAS